MYLCTMSKQSQSRHVEREVRVCGCTGSKESDTKQGKQGARQTHTLFGQKTNRHTHSLVIWPSKHTRFLIRWPNEHTHTVFG